MNFDCVTRTSIVYVLYYMPANCKIFVISSHSAKTKMTRCREEKSKVKYTETESVEMNAIYNAIEGGGALLGVVVAR